MLSSGQIIYGAQSIVRVGPGFLNDQYQAPNSLCQAQLLADWCWVSPFVHAQIGFHFFRKIASAAPLNKPKTKSNNVPIHQTD